LRSSPIDGSWYSTKNGTSSPPLPPAPPRRIRRTPTLATTTPLRQHDDNDGCDTNTPRFDYPPVVFFAVVVVAPLPIPPSLPPAESSIQTMPPNAVVLVVILVLPLILRRSP
jgi:hypothetical protein